MPEHVSKWIPFTAAGLLTAGILACAVYNKLGANLRGENANIARALFAGKGFANPFGAPTGPTAWMPPVMPCLQASLLWAGDGNHAVVVMGLVILHVAVLIGTGLLVIALAWQTTGRFGSAVAALAFALGLLANFRLCFESAGDAWLNMLVIDLLIGGLCWLRPLERWCAAAAWGLFGGLCAMVNPIVALSWGVLSLMLGLHSRSWSRLGITIVAAGLTVTPWLMRNYLVFGCFIPVKSNLAYELYQAHCLQAPGVLKATTLSLHPLNPNSRERQEYERLGEGPYLEKKRDQFWEAVWADPEDFLDRVANRFLCATVWYESFNPMLESRRPWLTWLNRVVHPLPFVALLILVFTSVVRRLSRIEWLVIGVYVLHLTPYIGASYYERYALPLLGVKTLLVVCAVARVPAEE